MRQHEILTRFSRLALASAILALAATPALSKAQQQSLAASIGVQVFPAGGQDQATQSAQEAECYNWAVSNSGSDPFEIQKQQAAQEQQAAATQQQASQAGRGSGTKGAVGGAAAGALIGEIVDDDAGKGAAYGAVIGGLAGRRRGKAQQQQATQQAQAQTQQSAQASEAEMNNFLNAFSACLEAKNYIVKY